ncbi:MAG: Two component, sigma54 specific, transcriptional regulator, Fis family [Candidatus Peregrinibacteria bacterium GW2011_GWA2_47_7]|nr:MAG: Two component, sigma54 specific, transcriptional regulator, Fis family [Candidatus Peregrinibacteria bacterium GW2011_GWA2_47_7]
MQVDATARARLVVQAASPDGNGGASVDGHCESGHDGGKSLSLRDGVEPVEVIRLALNFAHMVGRELDIRRHWKAHVSELRRLVNTFKGGVGASVDLPTEGLSLPPHRENYQDPIGLKQELAEVLLYGPSEEPVLLQGPSGCGKGVLARSLHAHSERARGPMVSVNCAAITETLLESEMFGAVRGAYTGAACDRPGFADAAQGGTLFLDEIGELSGSAQAALLTLVEERKFCPVGSPVAREADVRLIAATNRSLIEAVRKGEFREDLYYRLSALVIPIRPLNGREDEEKRDIIKDLVFKVDGKKREQLDKLNPISEPALQKLVAHHWQGNVRELRNVLLRAVVRLKPGETQIQEGHLVFDTDECDREQGVVLPSLNVGELERMAILEALRQCEGNRTRAAGLLGIVVRTLRNKIKLLKAAGFDLPKAPNDKDEGDSDETDTADAVQPALAGEGMAAVTEIRRVLEPAAA